MRATSGVARRKRKNRIFRAVKGYWGAKSKLYRMAVNAHRRAMQYAYIGRKQKKRDFRKLWIARINAACRMNDMKYSEFIHGLKVAKVELNRKMLAEIAATDEQGFKALVEVAKNGLNG